MTLSKTAKLVLKITAVVVLLPLVLMVVGFIYFYNADLSHYKGWVEKKVSQSLGRAFVIAGRFEPDFSLHPELTATQIRLATAESTQQPNMLELDELHIKVDLLSIFSNTFWIETLDMQGLSLRTSINKDGKPNWIIDSATDETKEAETLLANGRIKVPVMVRHLHIRDLDYLHQDGRDSSELTAKLTSVNLDFDGRDYITTSIQGKVMNETVNLKGEVGTYANIVNAQPVAVQLSNQFDSYQIDAKADLSYHKKVVALRHLAITSGKNNLSGDLTFDLTAKPVISGQLRSDYLDFNPFIKTKAPSDTTGDKAKPTASKIKSDSKYIIADAPLDLNVLQEADINIEYDGGFTAIQQYQFSNLDFHIKLLEGNLSITKFHTELPMGGNVKGAMQLQTLAQGYGIDLDLTGDRLSLFGFSKAPAEVNQLPRCELKMKFQSQGTSAHDIAAGGNGFIQLITEEGKIHKSSLSFFTNDIVMSLINKLNPFLAREEYTNLDCSILVVSIKQGIARLEPMLMITDKIAIIGEGQVNFRDEKLNINWNTEARKGLGINLSTLFNPYVRLGGTLAKPAIGLKPIEGAASAGLAVTTGGLSILGGSLLNRMKGEQDYCKKVKESLKLK